MSDTYTLQAKTTYLGLWTTLTLPWQSSLPWKFPQDGYPPYTLQVKQ
jgi:hypothetical protein